MKLQQVFGSSGASGSIGGITASHNRGGLYIRGRSVPVNPNTARQQLVRSAMQAASAEWSTLTDAQRAEWEVYAAAISQVDRLGNVFHLSGHQMYCACNSARLSAELDTVQDGPTVLTQPIADASLEVAISEATQKLSITFDDSADWCDEDGAALVVQMGIPQGAGRAFFNGPYRLAGTIDGDSTTAPSSPDANLDCPFPAASAQLVWVRCRILRADGRMSPPFRASCKVAV